jgi:hypothetical protein
VSDLHALLIGIDAYLPNYVPGIGRYPHLKGSVRDVTRVEGFLRDTLHLPPERIRKLTATENGSAEPAEPREQWPTYENMVAAFRRITAAASPGDQIYIHYSGHGARVKTIFPAIKGPDGLDEALVPVDIGDSTTRYLRDVELAHLLKEMVDRGLLVTLVLDSCHAGGATRLVELVDGRLAVPRGLFVIDYSTRRTDSLVGSPEELQASWPGAKVNLSHPRHALASTEWLPEPRGYVLIAACSPEQAAFEYPFEEAVSSGVLTHWLLDGLRQLGPSLTYQRLYDSIQARVTSQFKQTPVLVGEKDRVVFSEAARDVRPSSVLVLSIQPDGRHLRINTGQAQGVLVGTRFAIYRPEADLTQPEERLGVVRVVQYGATESLAEIVGDLPRGGLEPGCRAVLLDPGSLQQRRSAIRLVSRSSPATPLEQQALETIATLLEGMAGLVHVAREGEIVDFQVAVNDRHEIEIQDPTGVPVPDLGPRLLAQDPAAARETVARLVHLTRFRFVRELDNVDPRRPGLDVELLGVQAGYDPAYRPDPRPGSGGSALEMAMGEWTFLRITNRDSLRRVLNIAILDLQPDWGISQIFPGLHEENLFPLDPGQVFDLPLQGQLPGGGDQGTDLLKVFATAGAADFRWLELPALPQEPAQAGATRGAPIAEERALSTVANAAARARYVDPNTFPSEEWTTAQVEIRVRRR